MLLTTFCFLSLTAPGAFARGGDVDFGDAPDGAPTGYLTGSATGSFPSKATSSGPRHTPLKGLMLGASEDGETDSMQVDMDLHDDGVAPSLKACDATSKIDVALDVSGLVSPAATDMIYVNAWFDWNRDGDWGDSDTCAAEWSIKNRKIPVSAAGGGVAMFSLPFKAGEQVDELWMRVTVTVNEMSATSYGAGGALPYKYGETEDYYLLTKSADTPIGFPPPHKGGKKKPPKRPKKKKRRGGGGGNPGKGKFQVSCVPNPALILHGQTARVNFVVKDTGKGVIYGHFNSPRKTKSYTAKPNPVKPQPKGWPKPPWWIVDSFDFKHSQVDPPLRLETFPIKFTFVRGNQTQKLTCTILVLHLDNMIPVGPDQDQQPDNNPPPQSNPQPPSNQPPSNQPPGNT
ncbi:MAG: hypothetical protein HY827_05365 [Actinobacteria bacterium]|nr:hypothetical protein [Actinomycetota bacterium]